MRSLPLILLTSLICTMAPGAPATATTLPGANGLVAAATETTLVAIDPATTTRTPLLGSSSGDNTPAVSPNGATIAFVNEGNIFIAEFPSGKNRQQVTLGGGFSSPAFSPDSSRLVFAGPDGLLTAPAVALGAITTLTGSIAGDDNPEYSPDGRFVAFDTSGASLGASTLMRLNADGTAERTALNGSVDGDAKPRIAPDGSKVYFEAGGSFVPPPCLPECLVPPTSPLGRITALGWPNGSNRAELAGTVDGDAAPFPSPDGTLVGFHNASAGLSTVRANGAGGRASLPGSKTGDGDGAWSRVTGGVYRGPSATTGNPAPVFSDTSGCGGASMIPLLGTPAAVSASDAAGQVVTLAASGGPGYVGFSSTPGNPATGALSIAFVPAHLIELIIAALSQTPSTVTITATDDGAPPSWATCTKTLRVGIF